MLNYVILHVVYEESIGVCHGQLLFLSNPN